MRFRRILPLGAALLGLGAVSLALMPRPVPVATTTATRGPLTASVTAEGRFRIKDLYVVAAPVDGDLQRIHAEPGDSVAPGVTLARIAPAASRLLDARSRATARAAVRSAHAAVTLAVAQQAEAEGAAVHADSELATAQLLVPTGTMPRKALEHAEHEAAIRHRAVDAARAAAEVARSELARAEAQLASSTGRTGTPTITVDVPAPGRVLRVLRQSGGPVAAGTPLLEVGNIATLELTVDLLTADAMSVRPGAEATIRDWGGAAPLRARVRTVEPAAFTKVSALGLEEQRVRVVLDLVDAPPRLGHDFRMTASIVVWRGENVLDVPSTALFRAGDRWAVFVVERGRARRRLVTPGHSGGERTAIDAGLAPGDTVVVQPSDQIRDGTRVKGVPAPPRIDPEGAA